MSKAYLGSRARHPGLPKEGVPSPPFSGGELTAYFRQLGDRLEPISGPALENFWQALRQALSRELHRRGLWESPPRFVGIEAAESWSEEALEELSVECYAFLMQRLRALHQHLKLKPNIDGLVLLNIRHFLYERQKRCDPVGFQVFDVARASVRLATENGRLRIVGGSPQVDNSTLLKPRGGTEKLELSTAAPGELKDRCQIWADALMPDFILSRGQRRRSVEERLADYLGSMDSREFGAFLFKVLVDALKAAVRVRWKAVWVHDQGGAVRLAKGDGQNRSQVSTAVVQQLPFEDEESFRVLVAQVTEAVNTAPETLRQRDYLPRLWNFLRTSSADPGIVALPSRRKVAALLGIPRYVLPELYGKLGSIIEQCQTPQPPKVVERRQGERRSR